MTTNRSLAVAMAPQVLVQGVLSGVVATMAFLRSVQSLGARRAAVFPASCPRSRVAYRSPARSRTLFD
ncbi:hypothetical protein QA640_32525 [Bradyrhizobium sp. CB82]|uniref:hypothetical protein n=1 Tax=Bradyrhizobium sp. CB82 TaxID=3039159 RepID=UPI0024B27827|nr:hypothetical protein [Bradyrhizobium sp. CB82]WFU39084.1 hypothetical protein QA640_32525 [Bradyrhizobium sp. CB82]